MGHNFDLALKSLDGERTRLIIDEILSFEWCRQNLVVPVGIGVHGLDGNSDLLVAIGNVAYLGTVGEFIKQRAQKGNYKCLFVDLEPEIINQLLDEAALVQSD